MPGTIVCVFHFVRSALSAHRCVTDTVVPVYPLSRHAFQTFPCMKRATGLSKIHGSAMNIRTYPLSNKGFLTIQSLGIITMCHRQPLWPSSLLFSKDVARTAYQPSCPCHTSCTDHSIQQCDLLYQYCNYRHGLTPCSQAFRPALLPLCQGL